MQFERLTPDEFEELRAQLCEQGDSISYHVTVHLDGFVFHLIRAGVDDCFVASTIHALEAISA